MENIRRYAKFFGAVVATAVAVGLLANLKDIKRYVRISTM
jgi:hypothetical protein